MKKQLLAGLCSLCVLPVASAVTVTGDNFVAVQLREANAPESGHGTITPIAIAGKPGVQVHTPLAGQKVYFGTTELAGHKLSDIESIKFTYAYQGATEDPKVPPYNNFIVTDGAGSYGTVAATSTAKSTNGTISYEEEDWNVIVATVSFDATTIRFFEPAGNATWAHGAKLTGDDRLDLLNWKITNFRPLSDEENGVVRAPVNHGFALMWGDSSAGYLGERLIYDIEILATPEPTSLALLGVGGIALVSRRRR